MRKSIASVSMVLALLACRSDKPEDQVRKAFSACVTAVEAGDPAAAAEPLDATFRGPEGMDKAAARLFLMGILRQEKVGVTVVRNEVAVRGNEALQEVDLILTGRSGLLPQDASRRSFGLRWRKAGGHWRLLELQER
jgi:hypothetical protein